MDSPFAVLVLLVLAGSVAGVVVDGWGVRSPARLLSFSALALLYGGLHWHLLCRVPQSPPGSRWRVRGVLMVETVTVMLMGAASGNPLVTMVLCATLAGATWGGLPRAQGTVATALVITIPILHARLNGVPWRIILISTAGCFGTVILFVEMYQRQSRVREKAQAAVDELETMHRELAARAARIEELTLISERQRMARDLHDTLAQGLAGLILQLEAVEARLERSELDRAKTGLRQARDRARATLAEAREVIDDLRKTGALALAQSIRAEVARFSEVTGTRCRVELAELLPVAREHETDALRCVTEALTNAARHARASQVWVTGSTHGGRVTFEIKDNGVGFESEQVSPLPGRYGLLGLRERARLAGGVLTVESRPGAGTCVRLELPETREDRERHD